MVTVYGIPNCDTVKKARAWLTVQVVAHHFHAFKKDGVPADRLDAWLQSAGAGVLVNRRGTTWRKLTPADQAAADTAAGARALMLREPSVIKRPVVDWGRALTVGFDPADWAARVSGR